MDRLSDLLPGTLSRKGVAQPARAAHIVYTAQELIEALLPRMARDVAARTFEGGTLWVDARNAAALSMLRRVQPQLLSGLHSRGFTLVQRVVVLRRQADPEYSLPENTEKTS